jgi:hypothetical protein
MLPSRQFILLSYFEVRTPHIFVKLADTSGDDSGAADEDDMHMMPQRGLNDSQQCVRLLVEKETEKGDKVVSEAFIDLWLKDPKHRTYNKLNFLPPPVRCPADVYNLFPGGCC